MWGVYLFGLIRQGSEQSILSAIIFETVFEAPARIKNNRGEFES